MLVYGQNGKGKTCFGASGPRNVLIVDCNEKGSLSVRKFPGVDIFPLEVWGDLDQAFWFLASGKHEYKTVVIDTVTSLAQVCLRFIIGVEDQDPEEGPHEPVTPRRQDWGQLGALMGEKILQFRNLGMHVIFLAQERRSFSDDEDDDAAPELGPEVSPAVAKTLNAAVDIIGRMSVREVVVKSKGEEGKKRTVQRYEMRIGPSARYQTKDRSRAGLETVIRLPEADDNLAKLIDRIKEGV